ncbi:MAG: hypothetical protein ACFFFB_15585 [Candidatus Heimdallarchaeota archaeon]
MLLENPVLKGYIVNEIKKEIEDRGFNIEKLYVEHFIENFQEEYHRLPQKNEINSIVKSYIKVIEDDKEENISIKKEKTVSEQMEPIIKNFIQKKNILKSISKKPMFKYSEEILTLPKPNGRRTCPICGNESWFKIHEIIDKHYIISHYPRVYGKKYSCSGCGCQWREG